MTPPPTRFRANHRSRRRVIPQDAKQAVGNPPRSLLVSSLLETGTNPSSTLPWLTQPLTVLFTIHTKYA